MLREEHLLKSIAQKWNIWESGRVRCLSSFQKRKLLVNHPRPFLQFFSRFSCGLLPFQKEMETNRTIFAISLSFFLHFCRRRRFWASVRLSRTISGADAERRATDAGRAPSRSRGCSVMASASRARCRPPNNAPPVVLLGLPPHAARCRSLRRSASSCLWLSLRVCGCRAAAVVGLLLRSARRLWLSCSDLI